MLFRSLAPRDPVEVGEDEQVLLDGEGDVEVVELRDDPTARAGLLRLARQPEAEHLELALDILADVVWSPALRAEDVDAEREVILEELHMRDDQPDDLAHENFMEAVFPEHPLGRPVLGTAETIAAMTRDDIAAYHRDHYLPTNTVLSVAGNTTHDTVCDLVAARLPERTGDRPPRT